MGWATGRACRMGAEGGLLGELRKGPIVVWVAVALVCYWTCMICDTEIDGFGTPKKVLGYLPNEALVTRLHVQNCHKFRILYSYFSSFFFHFTFFFRFGARAVVVVVVHVVVYQNLVVVLGLKLR